MRLVRLVACTVAVALAASLGIGGLEASAQEPDSASRSQSLLALGRAAGASLAVGTGDPTVVGSDDLAIAARCVRSWDRDFLAGRVVLAGVRSSELLAAAAAMAESRIGGIVVFGSPGEGLGPALEAFRATAAGHPPVVAVDEEGGRVQRLRGLLGRLPAARSLAQLDTAALREVAAAHGAGMASLGFNMNLAPVLDVGAGPGIGDRSFADDPAKVAASGLAFAQGMEASGIVPVVKHFPGHGRASADSHVQLPDTPHLDELRGWDLEPFRQAVEAGLPAVMVAHLDVPGLTEGLPATLSAPAVEGLLRGELGFDGVILSDSLDMGAVRAMFSEGEAAVRTLAAGVDLALTDDLAGAEAARRAVMGALANGRLDPAALSTSVARVIRVLGGSACLPPPSTTAPATGSGSP